MRQDRGWAFPDADLFMATEMHEDGTYQASHLALALAYVTDWSMAVDGGAHVGTWARLLSGLFAKVIAVEPAPDTHEALAANMTTFGCANVELKRVALGAVAGTVALLLDPKETARRNTGARYVCDGGQIVRETLDGWDLPTLGFLKLDIEGAEVDALLGATETLRRCGPIVLFENKGYWRRYGHGPDAPQRLLMSMGYRHLTKAGCDDIWGPA